MQDQGWVSDADRGWATWAATPSAINRRINCCCTKLNRCLAPHPAPCSPLNGAALPASLAQLAGALTRLHLDCSGHAYTAADAERLRPGYAALWRLRACQASAL